MALSSRYVNGMKVHQVDRDPTSVGFLNPAIHEFRTFCEIRGADGSYVRVGWIGNRSNEHVTEVYWMEFREPESEPRDIVSVAEGITPPKWQRVALTDALILTESPSSVYDRVVVEGPTWQAKDRFPIDEPDKYIFEVFALKYLEHHEGAIRILGSSKTRAYMLEWSPVLVVCAEVLDAPGDAIGAEVGQMVWMMMDDLCEQDKINLWEFMGRSLPPWEFSD